MGVSNFKAKFFNKYVLPRISYYAPNLTISLEEMRENIENPGQKLLRKISKKYAILPN